MYGKCAEKWAKIQKNHQKIREKSPKISTCLETLRRRKSRTKNHFNPNRWSSALSRTFTHTLHSTIVQKFKFKIFQTENIATINKQSTTCRRNWQWWRHCWDDVTGSFFFFFLLFIKFRFFFVVDQKKNDFLFK